MITTISTYRLLKNQNIFQEIIARFAHCFFSSSELFVFPNLPTQTAFHWLLHFYKDVWLLENISLKIKTFLLTKKLHFLFPQQIINESFTSQQEVTWIFLNPDSISITCWAEKEGAYLYVCSSLSIRWQLSSLSYCFNTSNTTTS